jgi:hypothetical protein
MKRKNDIQADIEKDDPVLLPGMEKERGNNPFVVPGGYFDRLPAVIQGKVIDAKEQRRRILPSGLLLRPAYSWALTSVLVGLIIGSVYFFQANKIKKSNSIIITWEDVLKEDPDFVNTVSESMVIDYVLLQMADNGMSGETLDSVLNNNVQIPDEDLIEYLDNENNLDNLLYEL